MAARPRMSTELLIPSKWHDTETSTTNITERRISLESKSNCIGTKVPVIYYLSRNGHLEHPHFMEIPLSSSNGLYLKDVINRLNLLRGNGMATLYSWSSKRSYRNGYLWHDLTEDDLIHPTNGHEYVLKGSELIQTSLSCRSYTTASSSPKHLPETNVSSESSNFPAPDRRKNHSWTSFDNPQEYKVYKCESSRDLSVKSADAATQTDEERRRIQGLDKGGYEKFENYCVELSRGDLSPPPSNSSSETSDGLSGSRDVDQRRGLRDRTVNDQHPSGRMKASIVLKQLITCGSFDHRSRSAKEDQRSSEGVEYLKGVQRPTLDP